MLQPVLILASSSPRRRELLSRLGLKFVVQAPEVDEAMQPGEPIETMVVRLARAKAHRIADTSPGIVVLAADTLVELDGVALGKPDSTETARRYLQSLRARSHNVVTGVCLIAPSGELVRLTTTHVHMRWYTDTEIERSIAAGTPFDKAGAYAIQDEEFCPVESIDGCYCNVMGLPLWAVFDLLHSTDLAGCAGPPDATGPCCTACPLRR